MFCLHAAKYSEAVPNPAHVEKLVVKRLLKALDGDLRDGVPYPLPRERVERCPALRELILMCPICPRQRHPPVHIGTQPLDDMASPLDATQKMVIAIR